MSVKRGKDGLPQEVLSQPPRDKLKKQGGGGKADAGDVPTHRDSLFPEEPPTKPKPQPQQANQASPSAGRKEPVARGDPPTKVHRGGRSNKQTIDDDAALADKVSVASSDAPDTDPVAGWLVVVKGPGKGNFLKVGYGRSEIGRTETQRICLKFGKHFDPGVSKENQVSIFYDPENRNFQLLPGTGTNMVYIGDQPLYERTELKPGAQFRFGNTVLRFVPLCGADFCWEDLD